MGARRGGASVGRRPPLENLKKKKKKKKKEKKERKEKKRKKRRKKEKLKKVLKEKNVQTKFLAAKGPIVCYARKFPHKRPHVMC